MAFWKLAYDMGWLGKPKEVADAKLRLVVLTEDNPNGEISPEQYKEITGEDYAG